MSKVRGKFKVTSVERNHYQPEAAQIKLEAVYSGSPEDNTYAAATPSASIEMFVSNAAAFESLPLGKSFYVDFTPVNE
jgi:hypothetical protein